MQMFGRGKLKGSCSGAEFHKLLINYSSARLCTYPLQYSICAEAARLTRIVQLEDDPGGDLLLHLPRCPHTPNRYCSH
ncbi:hypothetical protein SRHO_G00229620 [Serrasalmus rhombeus]